MLYNAPDLILQLFVTLVFSCIWEAKLLLNQECFPVFFFFCFPIKRIFKLIWRQFCHYLNVCRSLQCIIQCWHKFQSYWQSRWSFLIDVTNQCQSQSLSPEKNPEHIDIMDVGSIKHATANPLPLCMLFVPRDWSVLIDSTLVFLSWSGFRDVELVAQKVRDKEDPGRKQDNSNRVLPAAAMGWRESDPHLQKAKSRTFFVFLL